MVLDENKAVIQRLFDDLFNRGRLVVADELVSPECVSYDAPAGTRPGPAWMRQVAARLRVVFPDGRYVIEDLIAEDDRVVARLVYRGTRCSAFADVPVTGRRVEQAQVHILRLAAGQIIEHWVVPDPLNLLAPPSRPS